ncbi:mothers against decapentaplegic homolog 6-like, partial [Brevipalpus obovatus]|uniref:mothers against decapentaplegic homolog 6-like n=1 Tax=Brevipalpus obovatus TaxID=246614 RepID=UPI003D9E0681
LINLFLYLGSAPKQLTNTSPSSSSSSNSSLQSSSSTLTSLQSTGVSTTYYGEETSHNWCTLSYWEFRSRVGSQLHVFQDKVDIFNDCRPTQASDGLCLSFFPVLCRERLDGQKIRKTRDKIGHGIRLLRDGCSVLVSNRSNYPIFVNSSTINPLTDSRKLSVTKILPGDSMKAFDFVVAKQLTNTYPFRSDNNGPRDVYSIRISFVKGWGPNYTRQTILACPCWLEVLFMKVYD